MRDAFSLYRQVFGEPPDPATMTEPIPPIDLLPVSLELAVEEAWRAPTSLVFEAMRAIFVAAATLISGAALYGIAHAQDNAKAAFSPGDILRDCVTCPEMIVIPAGAFVMGSADGKPREQPERQVSIARSFAMSRFEITFDEYQACVDFGACEKTPDDHEWGMGERPVINISFSETNDYVRYLRAQTGKPYRLPTEAEWEYAARAGTDTPFWWGDDAGGEFANCRHCGSEWDGKSSAPVGRFAANPFGLFDMNGNVWEWTSDCWNENYEGAPADAAPRTDGNCERRVIRSGSWYYIARLMSATSRDSHPAQLWSYNIGIRVVRELP